MSRRQDQPAARCSQPGTCGHPASGRPPGPPGQGSARGPPGSRPSGSGRGSSRSGRGSSRSGRGSSRSCPPRGPCGSAGAGGQPAGAGPPLASRPPGTPGLPETPAGPVTSLFNVLIPRWRADPHRRHSLATTAGSRHISRPIMSSCNQLPWAHVHLPRTDAGAALVVAARPDRHHHSWCRAECRVPLSTVGEVTELTEAQTRAIRGPRADPAALLLVRPYLRRAVYIEVTGAERETPYWLVGSRHPAKLAAAIAATRDAADGSRVG